MTQIAIERIVANPEQPRKIFDEDELLNLARSIETNGLLQPIIVEGHDNGWYILTDGERRWRACQLLNMPTIEAVVRQPSTNGTRTRDRLVKAFVANVQRADLNAIEEALGLGRMRDEMHLTHTQIADWVGWNTTKVAARLRLLELEPEIQELIANGNFPHSQRAVSAILSVENKVTRVRLAQKLARPGITIPAIVAACERLNQQLGSVIEEKALTRAPSVHLMQKPPTKPTERWQNVRAAAQGMCDKCSSNPKLPNLPEPAWSLIIHSAEQACAACSLRESAKNNLAICRQCPAVELLKRMVAHG